MAEEESDFVGNHLCDQCNRRSPTQFCICETDPFYLCDPCAFEHCGVSFHPVYPARHLADPAVSSKLTDLRDGAEKLKKQIRGIEDCKNRFIQEDEAFRGKYWDLQREVSAAFNAMCQSLNTCVEQGILEVKAHLTESTPSYVSPVAQQFGSSPGNDMRFRDIPAFKEQMEAMQMGLNQFHSEFGVKCPNLLETLEEKFSIPTEEKKREKLQSLLWRGKEGLAEVTKIIPHPRLIQISLTAFLILISIMCLIGFTSVRDARLVYPNPRSREVMERLGPYSGGHLATLLITTGPITLEAGHYKGQWEPRDKGNTTQESHIVGMGQWLTTMETSTRAIGERAGDMEMADLYPMKGKYVQACGLVENSQGGETALMGMELPRMVIGWKGGCRVSVKSPQVWVYQWAILQMIR